MVFLFCFLLDTHRDSMISLIREQEREQKRNTMAAYLNGRLESERNHSPYEASGAECRDCYEAVSNPDEDYCRFCSEPVCGESAADVADEAMCSGCSLAYVEARRQRKVKVASAIRHFAAMRASRDA